MRNKSLIKNLTISAVLLCSSAAILLGTSLSNNEKSVEVDATDTTTLYKDCEAAVAAGSASQLWTAVKTAASSGYSSTSYGGLWDWYESTDVKDGKIVDIYSNTTSYTFSSNQCGNYQSEGDCYNREHTIPKSWWGGSTSNGCPGSDIYIVLPSDGKVNGMRSNYPFGEVGTTTYTSNNSYSKLGSSNYSGYSGKVFEPNDEWKGDMARIYFYARAKWNTTSMTTDDGSIVFSGSDSTNYGLTDYACSLFMKWHKQDPVSDWERTRLEAASALQGNRNPFVDHPEYANYLFGGESMSATEPTALSISGSSSLVTGNTTTLTVTPTPSDAVSTVTWSSSNTSIATVSSSGLVTAISAGSVTITATSTVATNVSATFKITITNPASVNLTGVSAEAVTASVGGTAQISPTPAPSNAYPIPTYTYASADESIATVDSSGIVTGVAVGSTTITVTATQDSIVKTCSVAITVNEAATELSILPTDLQTSYPTTATAFTSSTGVKGTAYYVANYSSKIQFKKSSSAAIVSTESMNLKTITINGISSSGALTVYGGTTADSITTEITGTNDVFAMTGKKFFKIVNEGSKAVTCSSIVINTTGASTDTVTLNKSSLSLTVGGSETLTATASGTVTWSTSNSSVATVSGGTVTAIAAGTATITATCGTASATCVVTVSEVTFVNSIQECYSKADGASCSNVYGLYVGSVNNGASSIIMNGEYGIMLYKKAPDSSWVENETYLKVTTSSLSIYKNLYELASCTVETVTDATEIANNIAPVVTYNVTGSESSSDLTIANRLCTLTGKVSSGSITVDSDSTITMTVNSNSVKLFVKKASATSDVKTFFDNAGTTNEITIQGFTSFYTSFQVQFKNAVEEVDTYTAENFAQDLLDKTNEACTYSEEHNWSDVKSTLSPIWVTLEGANFYAKLPAAQKTILAESSASTTGTTIEQAMNRYDHIVARYGLNNFISGRSVVALNYNMFNNFSDSNNIIPIIVVITLVSVSTIVGFILIKRRREN